MVKREELTYASRDEISTIHAVRWIPDTTEYDKPKCIFQIVHGMQEYALRYDEFATWLAERGFLVIANDHLGHGLSSDKENYGYFCDHDAPTVVVRDVHRLKKMTQEQYPGIPIVILGHSMGSFILRNYICRYGTGIQGAIIMGTGSQPAFMLRTGLMLTGIIKAFEGKKYRSPFMENMAFGAYTKRIPDQKTSLDWLSVREENVQAYIADEMCGCPFTLNGYQTLFGLIKGAQSRKNLQKMPKELPVFFVAGAEDPVGHYGRDVMQVAGLFRKLGMQNVNDKLYEGSRHEILNEEDRETVYGDIYQWTKKTIGI